MTENNLIFPKWIHSTNGFFWMLLFIKESQFFIKESQFHNFILMIYFIKQKVVPKYHNQFSHEKAGEYLIVKWIRGCFRDQNCFISFEIFHLFIFIAFLEAFLEEFHKRRTNCLYLVTSCRGLLKKAANSNPIIR